jgi:hypothetical protein
MRPLQTASRTCQNIGVIKSQTGKIVKIKPGHLICIAASLQPLLSKVALLRKGEEGNADSPTARVAPRLAKGSQLFQAPQLQASLLAEFTAGCHLQRFMRLDKPTRERP